MKKYLFILATAAIVASCSDIDTFKEAKTPENKAIGFAAYSEKATKADQTNSTNLYDFYKAFSVYGFKTVNGTASAVFNNDPVEHFGSDVKGTYVYKNDGEKPSDEWGDDWATNTNIKGWLYEDIRFWDKMASAYSWFAIAPYAATHSPALTVADNLDNIQIGKPAQGETAADLYDITNEANLANPLTTDRKYFGYSKDYLLADKKTDKNELVDFTFHHILTKFNIKITLQESFIGRQAVKMDIIEIAGLEKKGYFVYNTNMTTNGWHTSDTYTLSDSHDYPLANFDNANATFVGTYTQNYSGYYWFQNLVFPQTLTCKAEGAQTTQAAVSGDKYLHIKYYIGDEAYESYYSLAYIFDPTLNVDGTYPLAQGSEYTINIKVGPEPIIFDANVNAWTVVDGVDLDI